MSESFKQILLSVFLVVIIAVIVGFVYFNFFGGKAVPVDSSKKIVVDPVIIQGKLDFNILENIFFQRAKLIQLPEIIIGEKGRDNPFMPF